MIGCSKENSLFDDGEMDRVLVQAAWWTSGGLLCKASRFLCEDRYVELMDKVGSLVEVEFDKNMVRWYLGDFSVVALCTLGGFVMARVLGQNNEWLRKNSLAIGCISAAVIGNLGEITKNYELGKGFEWQDPAYFVAGAFVPLLVELAYEGYLQIKGGGV